MPKRINKTCERCNKAFLSWRANQRCCSRQCGRIVQYGDVHGRLMSGISVAGHDECWEWTKCRDTHGYGVIGRGGRSTKSHRIAWEIANKQTIPDNMVIMHTCDNPPCCNPKHLTLGTYSDNSRDASAKGRMNHGEKRWNAKLTADAIRGIRAAEGTNAQIAQQFGTTAVNIGYIRRRATWKHVK